MFSGFPTTSNTDQAVQAQKMAIGLKCLISEVELLYYLCSKNKGSDQLRVTTQLICTLVFTYRGLKANYSKCNEIEEAVNQFRSKATICKKQVCSCHSPFNKQLHNCLRPEFFYFLFYRFFSQQIRVGGRNKNKNKIHSDHFPIELKLKETRNRVSFNFNSIGKWSE